MAQVRMNYEARANQVRIWRGQMTLIGYEMVRTRYLMRSPITFQSPEPDDECVSAWLKDKEVEINRRERWLFWWLVAGISIFVGAAAGVLAWPELVQLVR